MGTLENHYKELDRKRVQSKKNAEEAEKRSDIALVKQYTPILNEIIKAVLDRINSDPPEDGYQWIKFNDAEYLGFYINEYEHNHQPDYQSVCKEYLLLDGRILHEYSYNKFRLARLEEASIFVICEISRMCDFARSLGMEIKDNWLIEWN